MNRTALAYALALAMLTSSLCWAARPRVRVSSVSPPRRSPAVAASPVQKLTPRTTITTQGDPVQKITTTTTTTDTYTIPLELELDIVVRARNRGRFIDRQGGLAPCLLRLLIGDRPGPGPSSTIQIDVR